MSEIPEDAVESACAAFYNEGQLTDWNRLVEVDPYLAERYRKFMKTALKVASPIIREDEHRRIAESIGAKGYQVGEKRFPDNRAHGDDEWPYRHFTDGIDLAIEIAVQITEGTSNE